MKKQIVTYVFIIIMTLIIGWFNPALLEEIFHTGLIVGMIGFVLYMAASSNLEK